MAKASKIQPEQVFVHVLLIGDAKAGKTHWAAEAAKAGFNLIWLSADNSMQTLKQFDQKVLDRIDLLDVMDSLSSTHFVGTIWDMVTTPVYRWNDTKKRAVQFTDNFDESEILEFRLAEPDPNTVLVIDSYTSLAISAGTEAANRLGVSLPEIDKADLSIYAAARNKLTGILQCLQKLPCHCIVIAHPDEYQKIKKPVGIKTGEMRMKDQVIEWTKEIPMSFSKPHGAIMGKYFTDVLWIEQTQVGQQRMVDGRPNPSKIVGSAFSGRKKSDEYSFANLVKLVAGYTPTGESPKNLTVYGVGEWRPPSRGKDLPQATKGEQQQGRTGLFKTMT